MRRNLSSGNARGAGGPTVLALVAALVLPLFAPGGAGQDFGFTSINASLTLGALEGQGGCTTGQDDDGGYEVVEGELPDGATGLLIENAPGRASTFPIPQIVCPVDGSSDVSYSFRFEGNADSDSAGLRLYDSRSGTDPARAVLDLRLTALLQLETGAHSIPPDEFLENGAGKFFDVHFDLQADGRWQLCAKGENGGHTITVKNFIAPDPMPSIDRVAFYHAAAGLPAAVARWTVPESTGTSGGVDACPVVFDDFDAYAPGSDLAGQGGWSGDARTFIVAEERLADGSRNRYVDPSTNDKRDVDIRIITSGGKASASASMRSHATADQATGFYVGDSTEIAAGEALVAVLFEEDAMSVEAPDGAQYRLPGRFPPGSFFDVYVDVDAESDTADACVEDRANKLPSARKWSNIVLKRGSTAPPALDTLGLFVPETGTAKSDWDDVALVGMDVDLCPIFRDGFEGYGEGTFTVGTGGWQAGSGTDAGGYTVIANAFGSGQVLEHTPGEVAHELTHVVQSSEVLSFGASLATSDPSAGGPAIGVGTLRSSDGGGAFVEPFFDIVVSDTDGFAYTFDGQTGMITFGDGERGRVPADGSFFDIFVDLDAPSGRAEACMREKGSVPVGLYYYRVLATDPAGASVEPDALIIKALLDPASAAVARWDDVIHGAGDGDLCPTPPVMSIRPAGPAGNAGWFVGDVALEFGCHDAESAIAIPSLLASRKSASAESELDPAGDVLVAGRDEGVWLIELFCEVRPDHWSRDETTAMLDSMPPLTTATPSGTQGNNGWWRSDVMVTIACADATSGCERTTVTKDKIPPVIVINDPSEPVPVEGDGHHTLDLSSTDVAGNVEEPKSEAVDIDATPPRTAATLPPPDGLGGWYVAPPLVQLSCSDATSGCEAVRYRVGSGPVEVYDGPFAIDQDGVHVVEFWSEDVAGNVEAARTFEVKVDQTDPTVEIVRPDRGCAYVTDVEVPCAVQLPFTLVVGDVAVEAMADDATSGVDRVEFFVDGQLRHVAGTAIYGFPWDTSGDAAGDHILTSVAHDVAGNERSFSRMVKLVPLVGSLAGDAGGADPAVPRPAGGSGGAALEPPQ